ncbi:MAG: hypothetical protein CMJ58_14615 [Planctomycetaceae bacterium]|nr:hypothetical protein [Planctomycetaceae bacterium]
MTRRKLAAAILGLALAGAAPAEARLFWTTFGATVPTADGCAWNVNQDYFVPRHCDTCRYGLYSACKASRSISPACHHLHPLYPGYCTPYGACRYRWRDHTYKVHCGCTPLSCYYGPWRNTSCKHGCRRRTNAANCGCGCGAATLCYGTALPADLGEPCSVCRSGELPNVETFGGQRLGSLPLEGLALAGGDSLGKIPAGAVQLPALPPAQPQQQLQVLPGGFGF